jgi:hypothetical protein
MLLLTTQFLPSARCAKIVPFAWGKYPSSQPLSCYRLLTTFILKHQRKKNYWEKE